MTQKTAQYTAAVTVVLTVIEWRTSQHRKGLSFPCCTELYVCGMVWFDSFMFDNCLCVQWWNECYCLRRLQICCNHHKTYIHLIRLVQLSWCRLLNSTAHSGPSVCVYFSNVFRHFVSFQVETWKMYKLTKQTERQPNQTKPRRDWREKTHHRFFVRFFSSLFFSITCEQ